MVEGQVVKRGQVIGTIGDSGWRGLARSSNFTHVHLARHSVTASLAEKKRDGDGSLRLQYAVDPFELSGKVTPSPFAAVFDQHPHLRINCSLAAGLGDLARLISLVDGDSDVLPDELNAAVSGKVVRKVRKLSFGLTLPVLPIELGKGHTLRLVPSVVHG